MYNTKITPIIKKMRTNGGTLYTFSSALEDIGLNINERNNIVKLSNYALLNIPTLSYNRVETANNFNFINILGNFNYIRENIKDANIDPCSAIAQSFQNYALNMETCLLDDERYNPAEQTTVAERVFWKWLKETGAIRFTKDPLTNVISEELSTDDNAYSTVVTAIGEINAGSFNSNNIGTFNETYIQVPSSFGQTSVYFKEVEDTNYGYGRIIKGGTEFIKGRSAEDVTQSSWNISAYYDFVVPTDMYTGFKPQFCNGLDEAGEPVWQDGWWYSKEGYINTLVNDELNNANLSYVTDSSKDSLNTQTTLLRYVNNDGQIAVMPFPRSGLDCLSINFDVNKELYPNSPYDAISFEELATSKAIAPYNYDFNAVLVYYKVYNQTGDVVLATNLLGVLFLDSPTLGSKITEYTTETGNSTINAEINIPTYNKIQSSESVFGTSISVRISLQSNNMFDDTNATIIDKTDSVNGLNTFSEVFESLQIALNTLNANTQIIQNISQKYSNTAKELSTQKNTISLIYDTVNSLKDDMSNDSNYLSSKGGILTGPLEIKNRGISLDMYGNLNLNKTIIGEDIAKETGNILKNKKPFISSYNDNLLFGENTNMFDITNEGTIVMGNNILNAENNESIKLSKNSDIILIGNNIKFNYSEVPDDNSLSNMIVIGNKLHVEKNDNLLFIGNNTPIIEGDMGENSLLRFNAKVINMQGLKVSSTGDFSNAGSGTGLVVDESGNLLLAASSKRFKENIKTLENTSHILDITPVTYEYIARPGVECVGLIAEEVEQIDKRLVNYDFAGKALSVKYELLSVLLLNEVKKLRAELNALR